MDVDAGVGDAGAGARAARCEPAASGRDGWAGARGDGCNDRDVGAGASGLTLLAGRGSDLGASARGFDSDLTSGVSMTLVCDAGRDGPDGTGVPATLVAALPASVAVSLARFALAFLPGRPSSGTPGCTVHQPPLPPVSSGAPSALLTRTNIFLSRQ